MIDALAADDTRTLIVTGIGPAPGSDDPALQVFYRVGTTFPGWATSASTRRTGIVTLTDLTRTLVDFGAGPGAPAAATIDGSPLAVDRATLTSDGVAEHLAAVAALSDTIPAAYLVLGSLGGLLVAVGVVGAVRRDARVVRAAATVGSALPGAMLLTGARAVGVQRPAAADAQPDGRGRVGRPRRGGVRSRSADAGSAGDRRLGR